MSSKGQPDSERLPPRSPSGETTGQVISLSEALGRHRNSLGLIRLILASVVIFDHAFPLGGFGTDPFWRLTHQQASLGSLAVAGFFAVSGYLIAKSGMSGDVVQFMWRRILRIFPAYWLVLLVTAMLVGPLIWLADGHAFLDYFTLGPGGPFYYLTANWTLNIGTYGIHDLLTTTTPYGREIGGSAFNGSIWTLIYEWRSYLIIALMVPFGVLLKARLLVPVLTAFFYVLQIVSTINFPAVASLVPSVLADPYMINLGLTFLLGSTLGVYSTRVPYDDRLGILSGLLLLLSLRYGGFNLIGLPAGAYFVMYLAARLPKQVQWIGAKNDYSYGVYIYGFLVQQVLAYMGWYKWGYFPYVAAALVISFGCAWLSWHLVEKRAMALKNRGLGKGWRDWYDRALSRFGRKPREVTE